MSTTPWRNGIYVSDKGRHMIHKVDGQRAEVYSIPYLDFPDMPAMADGTWTFGAFGDFGPANEEVQKVSGGFKNNNVQIKLWEGLLNMSGVLSEDRKHFYTFGARNCLETLTWLSDEDVIKFSEDRDPIEAPSSHYKIQPENQGKLVWLSGPPGAGKSTTGQMLAKEAGYVYFEADCTMNCLNPFVPLDAENATLAAFQQKPLKVGQDF